MTDPPEPGSSPDGERLPGDRLDSWKAIAGHLKRDVRTVQRWEKREGMPVRRHLHDKAGSVYAYRADLDAWARSRSLSGGPDEGAAEAATSRPPPHRRAGLRLLTVLAIAVIAVAASLASWRPVHREPAWENPLADARFVRLTDFDGNEHAAAISRDGRFVAFVSDRDGRSDVWVTQVGTASHSNLTRGGAPELVNPSVRTLGFSPDGSLVTFWTRARGGSSRDIATWAVPLLGGELRRYLDGAAEHDWSADGARLVYHTPGPGDPMFVRDPGDDGQARHIFSAPEGLHAHFLLWSRDEAFIYFVQGALPDRLDIWRIPPAGGTPERITRHDAVVSHPVFLDERTLLYLVTDADGFGPWIYGVDVEERTPRRVGFGVERYTSLAASADGGRLVATVTRPKVMLWRTPVTATPADLSSARRITLPSNGSAPRLGPGYLLYVVSKGAADALWKLQDEKAAELWSVPETRIVGAPAIRGDGRLVAFVAKQGGRAMLVVANTDGTGHRVLTRSLELQGAPAWAPDGLSITVAAVVNGTPQLFAVPLDGGTPAPFVAEHAIDPVWSPDGRIAVFSGADVGTTFEVKAVKPDGSTHAIPELTLTRGARHLAFMPDGKSLVVLRGEIRHKNLWAIDLETGTERQLTDLPQEFVLRDFDLSPDGRELVLEQAQEQSDVVLIERVAR